MIKNPWIWQQNDNIKFPIIHEDKIKLPNSIRWIQPLIEQPLHEITIEAPSKENSNMSKEAARLIIIRRKKMKKHKLKKLRKRMKFEWAKVIFYYSFRDKCHVKFVNQFVQKYYVDTIHKVCSA